MSFLYSGSLWSSLLWHFLAVCGFVPSFLAHLRMRPVSRGNSRRSLVGGTFSRESSLPRDRTHLSAPRDLAKKAVTVAVRAEPSHPGRPAGITKTSECWGHVETQEKQNRAHPWREREATTAVGNGSLRSDCRLTHFPHPSNHRGLKLTRHAPNLRGWGLQLLGLVRGLL